MSARRKMKKKTIFLVPHTHYDVAWAFNREDYLLIFSSILIKALNMIDDGGFKFLIEQTFPLEAIEHRNPELFERVETAIAAGNIEIVDGQYLMPDFMIPGGEVLVREILYGKRYCREKFDIDIPVAWAADGFGLNAQMPQIYKKSGYRWLAFRRGLPRSIGASVSEFLWEGLDGSKILSHWMPLGYRAGLHLDKWDESYRHLARLAITPNILMPCGSGGAIPQEEIPDTIAKWNKKHRDEKMLVATPYEFFARMEDECKNLITFKGELYSDELENIFPDVASSRVRLRLAIRNCELDLLMAEKAAALAFMHGKAYPEELLHDMWRKKLFLAMHDIVPGTGIDEIYEEAWDYIDEIQKATSQIMVNSIKHTMPGKNHGNHIIVFNPNSWDVEDWVEVDVALAERMATEPGIALDGNEVPSEAVELQRWDDGSVNKVRIGFIASAPALGCRIYSIVKKKKSFRNSMKVKGNEIRSKFFTLSIDEKTGIITVFDIDGEQILTGNELLIDEELGDLYFHRSLLEKYIGSESGEGLHFGIFKPEGLDIHKGSTRTVITFKNAYYCLRWPYYLIDKYEPLLHRHKTVEITKKVIVYKAIPRIDFETELNLLQPHVRIRLKFDTRMVAPRYARQTQFGVITIPLGKTLRESLKQPSLNWICGEEGDRGIAVMTLGVPINEIKGGEIYCTLLRSVSVLAADGKSGPLIPTPDAQELGKNHYRYSIYPYRGTWKEALIHRRGYETSQPLRAIQVESESSEKEFHSFTLEPDNLILTALKKAEDGDGLVMRFFETRGEHCIATICVPDLVQSAKKIDLIENEEGEVAIENGTITMEVGPFEIVTLELRHRETER
jgi:alpha-mannosidase